MTQGDTCEECCVDCRNDGYWICSEGKPTDTRCCHDYGDNLGDCDCSCHGRDII